MSHTDFIPRPDAAFENFFKIISFLDFVIDNAVAGSTIRRRADRGAQLFCNPMA
jgi:hypothetical protein